MSVENRNVFSARELSVARLRDVRGKPNAFERVDFRIPVDNRKSGRPRRFLFRLFVRLNEERFELRVVEQNLRAAVFERVGDFVGRPVVVERIKDRADLLGREVRERELVTVVHNDRKDVPFAEPVGAQRVGEPVRLSVEFFVRPGKIADGVAYGDLFRKSARVALKRHEKVVFVFKLSFNRLEMLEIRIVKIRVGHCITLSFGISFRAA